MIWLDPKPSPLQLLQQGWLIAGAAKFPHSLRGDGVGHVVFVLFRESCTRKQARLQSLHEGIRSRFGRPIDWVTKVSPHLQLSMNLPVGLWRVSVVW